MPRATTTLLVFFICFNLFAGLLAGSGVAAALGIDTTTGANDERNSTIEAAQDVPAGNGIGETLFAMYNVVTTWVSNQFGFITPGLNMLAANGVPTGITDLLRNLFFLISGIDTASFLVGRYL